MVNSVQTNQMAKRRYFGLEKHPEVNMAQVIFLKDNLENGLLGKFWMTLDLREGKEPILWSGGKMDHSQLTPGISQILNIDSFV